jgi:predicted Zn-dependent protease
MTATTPFVWIESTSWELDFFGLPHRIPWPADVDPAKANEDPLDTAELVRAIEMLGPDAGEPWNSFRLAAASFDELAEALEDGEHPRAEELLAEVERLHPGTSFVAFHRGMIARHDARFEEAVEHYETAAQKTPGIGVIWLHLGTLHAQEGNRDQAIAALNHAVRCNPQDTNALEVLASLRAAVKVLRDANDPKSAVFVDLGTFRKMAVGQLKDLADNHAGLISFGEFQLQNGFEKDLGVQAFERAAQLQPEDPRTLVALANAYRATGEIARAKATAQRLVELHPNEPQAWFNLAQMNNFAGDRDAEHAALKKMLELDKNAQPALGLLFGLNDGPTEEKERQLVEHGEKEHSCMAFLLASSVARDRGETAAAVRHAARAYEMEPEREDVLLHYAAMLGDAKDRERLTAIIEPAMQSGKYSKRLDWNYAQALRQCGRVNEAVQVLINAASGEGVPQDFQQAAASTIDFWTGRLAESGIGLQLTKAKSIARPVIISLDGEDGALILQAGRQVPCETQFPWRVRLHAEGETRIALQQGMTGSTTEPLRLGAFAVKVPPMTGAAHTIQCLIGVNQIGNLLFKAVQNGRELPVAWVAPAEV